MVFKRFRRRNAFRSRRRFIRRRFSRFARRGSRGLKTNAFTAQRGTARALRFGGRRISRRHWRSSLLATTRHKAHYRSVANVTGTYSTGTTQGSSVPTMRLAVGNVVESGGTFAGVKFWTTAGGLQPYDVSGVPPTNTLFQDDIIIRGGMASLHLALPSSATDTVGVRLWWGLTDDAPVASNLPGTAQPFGWDPTLVPDFNLVTGRIIKFHESVLNVDNNYVTFECKMPIRKANQARWLSGGRQLFYVLQTSNMTSATSVSINFLESWNMSFSADAVGAS